MNNSIRPLFMLLSTILIVSGAGMALMFGWVGYHVIYNPEAVPVLSYVLGHMPAPSDATVINGNANGVPFSITLPQSMIIYAFTLMMIVSFGVLLAISRCLSGIGIELFKILAQTHREEKRPMAPVSRKTKPVAPEQPEPPEENTPGNYQF